MNKNWDKLEIEYFTVVMTLAWECSEEAKVPFGSDKTKGLQRAVAVMGLELFGELEDLGNVSREEIERVLVSSPANEREAIFLGLCPQGWELFRMADVYGYARGCGEVVFLVLMDGLVGLRYVVPGHSGDAESWVRKCDVELAAPCVGLSVAAQVLEWCGV